MTNFLRGALKKFDKLTPEQTRELLSAAASELEIFREVLTSVTKGILVCDIRHRLILTNDTAERLLQIPSWMEGAEVVWALIRNREISGFVRENLLAGNRVEDREFSIEYRGIERLLNLCVLPLVDSGHVTGSLLTAEDITEKRIREIKLHQAENLANLTTVAAGVAHEIKNPLTSLSIHAQLIHKLLGNAYRNRARKADTEENISIPYAKFNKYITTINEEIQRLNKIVVDFLFAVRPMQIFLVKSDINKLVRDVVNFVHFELKEANVKCKLVLEKNIANIALDKRYMKQALLNLIKNAVEAMTPGGGLLTITTETAGQEVQISVRDNGTGIADADKAKIFEPYFTTKIKGSGLGLTLVFKIVREHRGDINVVSKRGEGACFTIRLPIPQKDSRLLEFGTNTD